MQNKFQHRLFGRTRGRSKNKINFIKYYEDLNNYKITNFDKDINYIIDIGTGYGETSIYLSKNYSEYTIVSCEKYINGNLNLLKMIDLNKINNIKLHNGNVYEILDLIKNKCIKIVWVFFPDPWPKKRHIKRRLINRNFLIQIHEVLKKNGEIHIATDSISYKRAILNSIYECKDYFFWLNQSELHLQIKDYFNIETKYYKKAIISQRKPTIFILRKL